MHWKTLLVVGVAVMFIIVVMSGKDLFYKGPQYSDYVDDSPRIAIAITDQAQCENVGGKWFEPGEDFRAPRSPIGVEPGEVAGWCDEDFEKREAFDKARGEHDRNSFIILMIVGIGTFIGGMVVSAVKAGSAVAPSIGVGLAIGGIIVSIIGTAAHWDYMNEPLRFILAVVGLLLIMTVAKLIPKIMKRMQNN